MQICRHTLAASPADWFTHRARLVALLAACLCGCANDDVERTAAAAASLSPAASIYVAVSADGRFADLTYPGSGQRLAELIVAAFDPYVNRAERAAEAQPLSDAMADARAGGFTYLAMPRILRWEDRSADWTGLADQAAVRLALIEVRSGRAADIAVIVGDDDGSNRGQPDDRLVAPLARYTAALVSKGAEPASVAR